MAKILAYQLGESGNIGSENINENISASIVAYL